MISTTHGLKRGHAVNGDVFRLAHPTVSLDQPFTSFIDVSFRGVTHQVLSMSDRTGFNFANTTGEFSVLGLHGYIIEALDTVETQVAHRYQAIIDTPHGALSTTSHDSVDALLSLVGALRPTPTRLGVTLDPNPDVEYTSAPRIAMQLEAGMVEVTPLTQEVIDQLPAWKGTPVRHGQLYAGHFSDSTGYLTLITPTCRVVGMLGANQSPDAFTVQLAEFRADWQI